MIRVYKHKVQYYETDQMGIVHHSNYIRWFEEARTDLMEQAGFGYDRTESCGIRIPVLGVECNYLSAVRYGEAVCIIPRIEQFSGVRMTISYKVLDAATGALRTTGESRHCFVDAGFRPVSLKKAQKELYDIFTELEHAEQPGCSEAEAH